ncbi:dipeptide ABC transporter ATP-binding protein [Ignatzschineria rhizosphaerae]|uniref:ABC-type dipeptide transporter n=1 Tax=Ignatzschineria rhizosphaerae TaxID=2923279 RepID=A0ABY3X2S7_9GAMM|nr:dipeptide ABC transporter ATP-binding protein [Ignatzschineria rhizosphaerae]UNM95762.1 dipeptide ABC transporter ATP-binding protein [Ignatzschineria rhizosphaerae]
MTLLKVDTLTVEFGEKNDRFRAVDRISYTVDKGEVVGIVGESGSGKSVSSLAIMGLIDFPGTVTATSLEFDGRDLQTLKRKERMRILGDDVAMIFQDPMTSLNPSFTVGYQIMETLKAHQGGNRKARKARTIELLSEVGIPDAANRFNLYPHQLSGGMSQRVMIAMAIACSPKLLIADEPTTALDVTIQGQIMSLLLKLQKEQEMALLLITHDLALVAESADKIVVMYAGQVVEVAKSHQLFSEPFHPYTEALLKSLPEFSKGQARLESLSGVVPGKYDRPKGCLLNPRCPYKQEKCTTLEPELQKMGERLVKCHFPLTTLTIDRPNKEVM